MCGGNKESEMTDEQITEIAKRLYGNNLTEKDLSTHQTIEFARLIEKQIREEDAKICDGLKHYFGYQCAEAIRSQK